MVAAVEDSGALRLADGRTIRLAGLDLGRDALSPADWQGQRAAIARHLADIALHFDAIAATDRWGRTPGFLFRPGAAEPVADSLAGQGLARALIGDGVDHCLGPVLRAEQKARTAEAGLWRMDGARLADATIPEPMRALRGRYAVIEGQILSVGERPLRTYLNFGRRYRRDFAATVRASVARQLKTAGFALASLGQKRVRLRGYIGGWRAPRMEIRSRAQIEIVGENER